MANQLKELLGLDVPILQGGMAWISEANLASAVSNAGGAGIISTGGRTTEYTRDEIRRCRSLTDRPFGVNRRNLHSSRSVQATPSRILRNSMRQESRSFPSCRA